MVHEVYRYAQGNQVKAQFNVVDMGRAVAKFNATLPIQVELATQATRALIIDNHTVQYHCLVNTGGPLKDGRWNLAGL